MSDHPTSPYAGLGLDKSLLRSTKQSAVDEVPIEPTEPATHVEPDDASISSSTTAPATDPQSIASVGAPIDDAVIETIRKTVKTTGREVSFVRLTPAEKGRLADIVYTYKRQGIKTSETEINRIAVNYLIADYQTNGEQSILARTIAALLA